MELGATNNVIEGNYIGTGINGARANPNSDYGILVTASPNNLIGGLAAGAANVISGNSSYGIQITGADSTGNLVEGNDIGTDSTGTIALGNGNDGIEIDSGATSNTIGGTSASAQYHQWQHGYRH